MVDDPDAAINTTDRPVVQASDDPEFVEIVWPHKSETTKLHNEVAMAMFSDMMRIVSERKD